MGTDPKEARGVPLVEAIRQDAPNSRGRVLLGGRVLKLPVRLGKGHRTLVFGIPQMPDDPSTNDRGEIRPVGETVTVFLIGKEIGGQRQVTPRQHRHQALGAERTNQAIESHRGDMIDDRTPL